MSYLPTWPRRVFFYALLPAATGGQTPLTSSRDVMLALPESVVRTFREKKVTYIRHFQPNGRIGKSWQATYETSDRAEVEAIIREQGSTFTWLANGVLRVRTTCEAVMRHPETGEEVWFNQAEQWHPSALASATREMFEQLLGKGQMPLDCEYGDGDPFDDDVLAAVRDALNRHKLVFDWQPHDLLVLDNVLMMHGREPYTGPRKTLAYLSAT